MKWSFREEEVERNLEDEDRICAEIYIYDRWRDRDSNVISPLLFECGLLDGKRLVYRRSDFDWDNDGSINF